MPPNPRKDENEEDDVDVEEEVVDEKEKESASDSDDGNYECTDVDTLFKELEIPHNPEEWRLFLDGSRKSFKAVLLHNGNINPSILLGLQLMGSQLR
ncbi:hypothetical protein DMENIID0001_114090 [Sergentomyia squamirostris]